MGFTFVIVYFPSNASLTTDGWMDEPTNNSQSASLTPQLTTYLPIYLCMLNEPSYVCALCDESAVANACLYPAARLERDKRLLCVSLRRSLFICRVIKWCVLSGEGYYYKMRSSRLKTSHSLLCLLHRHNTSHSTPPLLLWETKANKSIGILQRRRVEIHEIKKKNIKFSSVCVFNKFVWTLVSSLAAFKHSVGIDNYRWTYRHRGTKLFIRSFVSSLRQKRRRKKKHQEVYHTKKYNSMPLATVATLLGIIINNSNIIIVIGKNQKGNSSLRRHQVTSSRKLIPAIKTIIVIIKALKLKARWKSPCTKNHNNKKKEKKIGEGKNSKKEKETNIELSAIKITRKCA